MGTLLLKNARLLVTMDEQRRKIHLYQTLTRALPAVQNVELFDWLVYLYPIWAELSAEAVYNSALVGLAELLLTGCTTASDHLYLVPNDSRHDDEIRAARELGIRFHACRGSMSLGKSQGGLPPDSVVQTEDEIIADCERLVAEYHDPEPYSMLRIVLAPCSPFSVTGERLDWVGPDVWYAHAIFLNEEEIALMAETGTGVAHCPTSNMRLGSGIAPIREMLDAGVKVGLAVDGSASNDSSHMLAEARMAMLLQRVTKGASALTAEEALELATLGGAEVLGRDDLGSLAPGKAARQLTSSA